jgi:hypothetical protein
MTKYYRVRFLSLDTGKGFIDGYRTAKAAKAAVECWNAATDKTGVRAEYLGKVEA